jgi:hypothetical protein
VTSEDCATKRPFRYPESWGNFLGSIFLP